MSLNNSIDRLFFKNVYNQFEDTVNLLIGDDCSSLLDLGCGKTSPIKRKLKDIDYKVGVDIFEESLEEAKKNGFYNNLVLMNVLEIDKYFSEKSFDVVIGIDLIEHLEKSEGYKLIEIAEKLAKKRIIFFTPNGYLYQDSLEGNIYQRHKSGWSFNDFTSLGFKVYGINGLKFIRGYKAEIMLKPKFIWSRISMLSRYFVFKKPWLSSQLLCVKNL